MSENFSWIARFGVRATDHGYVYMIENCGKYKIGRSKKRDKRIKEARTWLPDMKLVDVKPFWNVKSIERNLHAGFAACWHAGEWFEPIDDSYAEILIEGFSAFSDIDRDKNSVDFIYWFNSEGMAEFVTERYRQGLTLPKFLKQEKQQHENYKSPRKNLR